MRAIELQLGGANYITQCALSQRRHGLGALHVSVLRCLLLHAHRWRLAVSSKIIMGNHCVKCEPVCDELVTTACEQKACVSHYINNVVDFNIIVAQSKHSWTRGDDTGGGPGISTFQQPQHLALT